MPLLAFDGFAQQSTIDDAGAAANGMYAGLPGLGADDLPQAGKDFVAELEPKLNGKPVEQFAPYAGQAADVVLRRSTDGTDREAIAAALFGLKVSDGIVGDFEIEPRAIRGSARSRSCKPARASSRRRDLPSGTARRGRTRLSGPLSRGR